MNAYGAQSCLKESKYIVEISGQLINVVCLLLLFKQFFSKIEKYALKTNY